MNASEPNRGGRSHRVSFGIPIGQVFQRLFDAQVERLRHAVIPLVAPETPKGPASVGSAVLVQVNGVPYLVTANHVLEDHPNLQYFDKDGVPVALIGDFHVSRAYDVAVLRLIDEHKEATARYPMITEGDFRPVRYAQGRQYAAIVGFPATASKYLRKERLLKTEACSIANMVTQEAHGRIAVKFEKPKNLRAGSRAQITAPDPYGMSGGAIFSVPSPAAPGERPDRRPL